jgi:hypothetical protein
LFPCEDAGLPSFILKELVGLLDLGWCKNWLPPTLLWDCRVVVVAPVKRKLC